jgi:ribosomal protein L11 methyltransferase
LFILRESWEKTYPAVRINDVYIHADFHPQDAKALYSIRINPQMSFGTAHHETTALMIEMMQRMDLQGKKLMDMGSGTAILAILAKKMNASQVDAIDNDDWAYKNALSNVKTNKVDVTVFKGDASFLKKENKINYYDVFIANINRNIP